jgi:Transposase, Mutator family
VVARNLRAIRAANRMRQTDVADATAGRLTRYQIAAIETGTRKVDLDDLPGILPSARRRVGRTACWDRSGGTRRPSQIATRVAPRPAVPTGDGRGPEHQPRGVGGTVGGDLPRDFLPELIKAVLERGLAVELADYLGYEKGDPAGRGSPNSRNGSTPKRVLTEVGPLPLEAPRDRNSSFEPRLVPKGVRRLGGGLDEMIISLYAGGMTVRGIGRWTRSTPSSTSMPWW